MRGLCKAAPDVYEWAWERGQVIAMAMPRDETDERDE